MHKFLDANMTIRPASIVLAGLGAALLAISPTPASAATRACAVTFSVTSSNDLQSLQFDVDYAAASASGDFTSPAECSFNDDGNGITDVLVNQAANTMGVGWANTTSFDAPGAFATCRFDVTGSDPTAPNFVISNIDASSSPGVPTTATVTASVVCVDSGSCGLEPATGCKKSTVEGKSALSFGDNVDDTKDKGKYQWKSGEATDLADFLNPMQAGATYSWCVYKDGELAYGADVPAVTGWKATGTKGFGFKGDSHGIASIKLKSGDAGKASVQVQGKSKAGNFHSPGLPLTGSIKSQLVIDDGMTTKCFEANMGTDSKATATAYSAKGVLP